MTRQDQPSALDWPAPEPLGASGRRRRDEMLVELRGALGARRRRRLAGRAGLAVVALLAGAGVLRAMTRATPGLGPGPVPGPIATAEGPRVEEAPARPLIAVIGNDPTVLERLSSPAGPSRITILDDTGLLTLLERAGSPGLVRVDGRVILTRELPRPAESEGAGGPQSRASRGEPTRG